jgi:hypothetical protein
MISPPVDTTLDIDSALVFGASNIVWFPMSIFPRRAYMMVLKVATAPSPARVADGKAWRLLTGVRVM